MFGKQSTSKELVDFSPRSEFVVNAKFMKLRAACRILANCEYVVYGKMTDVELHCTEHV